jgi:hypothetical protein
MSFRSKNLTLCNSCYEMQLCKSGFCYRTDWWQMKDIYMTSDDQDTVERCGSWSYSVAILSGVVEADRTQLRSFLALWKLIVLSCDRFWRCGSWSYSVAVLSGVVEADRTQLRSSLALWKLIVLSCDPLCLACHQEQVQLPKHRVF